MRSYKFEATYQNLILLISAAILVYFFGVELDGLAKLWDFLWNALISLPDFIEKLIDYFEKISYGRLWRSLLVGAIFGAGATAIVTLSAGGLLLFPRFSNRAVWGSLLAGGAAYFFMGIGFWNAIVIVLVGLVLIELVIGKELRRFLGADTLRRLNNRPAFNTLVMSLVVGGVIGAAGSQILMYPIQHCTYGSQATRFEYRAGLAVTAASTLFLLIPTWTWLNRRYNIAEYRSTAGYFRNRGLPYLLLLPTLLLLVIFLYYPASQMITLSLRARIFPLPQERFVCLQNYTLLKDNVIYQNSFTTTLFITVAIVLLSIVLSLVVAVLASQKVKGADFYRTLLVWPYAISPVVTGVIFLSLFREGGAGVINWALNNTLGIQPKWLRSEDLAPWVIILASVWNVMGFNILFYVAGLQNIPQDLLEAAALDGANRVQRFVRVTFPLLAPFTFFLLVTNVTFSFYGIYGVVDTLTQGGPPLGPAGSEGGATNVLINKLYQDGFQSGSPIGQAAAQSLILFLLVGIMTIVQFRYIERRVTYGG